MDYLLRNLPSNFRMILSCIKSLQYISDSFVDKELWLKYEMNDLDPIAGKMYIEKYFEKYNKVISIHKLKTSF